MTEQLLSVGVDIGTTTTQLVFSRLTLENQANPFSIPRIAIAKRELLYRSAIHLTPLLDSRTIDGQGVRDIVAGEYRRSGYDKGQVQTGAVIITGETARKENAREVLSSLAGFAGDFVVATAGPDLESILAARGAGADQYSKENCQTILHFDIGGGTSNLALYQNGALISTGCFDIGGRMVKLAPDQTIVYVSPKLRALLPQLQEGRPAPLGALREAADALAEGLAQAAGLYPGRDKLEHFRTEGTRWTPPEKVDCLSFSGGVADCLFEPPGDPLAYGDLGVLLGQALAGSDALGRVELRRGAETIRATVVGAGAHAAEISGATIFYREVTFPIKNVPILKLTAQEEAGGADILASAIGEKLRWYADEGGFTQAALGLRGESSPSYPRIQALAQGIAKGLSPMLSQGLFPIVVTQADTAKVLGQALAPLIKGPLLSLDGVGVENGDYIDVGAPVAHGSVLPVVIKTLVFNKEDSL